MLKKFYLQFWYQVTTLALQNGRIVLLLYSVLLCLLWELLDANILTHAFHLSLFTLAAWALHVTIASIIPFHVTTVTTSMLIPSLVPRLSDGGGKKGNESLVSTVHTGMDFDV